MKTNSKIVKLLAVTASVALMASCTESSSSGAPGSDVLAGNIVGGTVTTDAFQKQNGVVALVINSNDGQGICTGTLIAPRLVLTAAHCLDSSRSQIQSIAVVFSNNIDKVTQDQVRFGVKGAVHPDFLKSAMAGGDASWNDTALLKLDADAPVDFKPARLPKADNLTAPKTMLMQMGYGRAEASRAATTDTSGILRQVSGIAVIKKSADGKELLLNEAKKGSCNGDSGGPAFVKERDGKLTLVGTDSRGTDEASCIGVGVYTNVASHLDWIAKTSAALLADKTPATQPELPAAPSQPAAPPSVASPVNPSGPTAPISPSAI